VSRRATATTLLFVLTGALLAFVGRGAPAGAIETASYGLDVATTSKDSRLHIDVRAGETTTGRVRVWNKSQQPLTLQLTVAPAQVTDGGAVALGGDGDGVDWVSLVPSQANLAPGAEQIVEVRVKAPRKIDGGKARVVAVQVEPAAATAGDQPAVVQRLALTTYLEPDAGSLIASLGPFPWIALAVLVVVGVLLLRAAAGRRRRSSATAAAAAEG
jgi:hypothetical protein